ncbi:tectonic-3-like [Cylas formicarius]|uniref:tectonic-3-like n=1 Tax=Cylas formicarius TaxID=197179 RepID=UPI00295898B4|nr:tectonic-3-like [Cylas formicarius]
MYLAWVFLGAWFFASGAGLATTTVQVTTDPATVSCDRDGNCTTVASEVAHLNVTGLKGAPSGRRNASEETKSTERDGDSDVCTCNLQRRYCDVNCCCDRDCDGVDKRALFGYCDVDGRHFYDDRYCDYVRHVYVNNTPYEWWVHQAGLFCVVKSNAPKSYVVQRHEPIRTVDDFEGYGLRNVWNVTEWRSRGGFRPDRKMTYGDPIWLLTVDGRIEKLALPKRFLTSSCAYDEDVGYLKPAKSSCELAQSKRPSLLAYFADRKVIIRPHLFNATDNSTNSYATCPGNVCRAIDVAVCAADNFDSCTRMATPPAPCSRGDPKSDVARTCGNATVERIRYVVRHNGSDGIDSVRADLIPLDHVPRRFVQHFSVVFYWTGRTANYSTARSGNPGYVPGRAVLAAVRDGSSIRRNSTAFADNFLTLPGVVRGRCAAHSSIDFGYDGVVKCALRVNVTRDDAAACRRVQVAILNAWSASNGTSRVVGLFGNADASRPTDWTDVLDVENASVALNRTGRDAATSGDATLTCRRLATSLFVDVVYARVDFERLKEQNKILGVTRRFLFENLTFGVGVETDVELRGAASFHDVTAPKRRRFVEPPRLDIRLPYDFFYPFVRIGNVAEARVASAHSVLVCYVLALLIN